MTFIFLNIQNEALIRNNFGAKDLIFAVNCW